MSTLAASIKAALSGAKAAGKVIRRIETSESLQARFNESVAEVNAEMLQVCYAVCRALVARAMGPGASDETVGELLGKVINDPAAPYRMHRLLGEARKSASDRRRRFLAAMFFGLPFAAVPDDERDRLDMVVERLVPADVDLLMKIDRMDREASELMVPYDVFSGSRVAALISGVEIRLATTDDYRHNHGFHDSVQSDERFRIDHTAFSSLISLGCISAPATSAMQSPWEIHNLVITELGRLLVQAINEVQDSLDGGI